MSNLYLECDCSSDQHLVKVSCDVDDTHPQRDSNLCLHTQLIHQRWYVRIWYATKYVFGYQCRYGHWEETVLNLEKVEKLHMLLHAFNREIEEKAKALEVSKPDEQ